MCAIAGVLSLSDRPDASKLLDAIRHRGPDQVAVLRRGPCEIAAAHLAIVDPMNGAQPMVDEMTGTVVAFNGEIYNAATLREALQARGHRFRGKCDTEVFLRGWIEWGIEVAGRLHGMFAAAVLEPGRLTLLRDPLGIKPMRFAHIRSHDTFLFASEAKALLRHPLLSAELAERAFADFIALGYPTGERTLFEGISTLPPGCHVTVNWDGALHVTAPRRYVGAARHGSADLKGDAADDAFINALLAAVRDHLRADAEVVMVLSGGIDSSTLAFAVSELSSKPIRTFTVADRIDHADAIAAQRVADAIGADHTLLIVGFEDYLAAIPETIAAVEAPDLQAGPAFHLLCRRIGQSARACINGEGADETLGGYFADETVGGYYSSRAAVAWLHDGFRRARAAGLSPSDRAHEIMHRLTAAAADPSGGVRETLDIALSDLLERAQLDPVDHISMASAVEMRVPFLDARVQAAARSLAPAELVDQALGITKRVLRRAAVRRYGSSIVDMALRRKFMMPDASGRHALRFEQLCAQAAPDHVVRRSEYGCCFASKSEFVLFELFRSIYFPGASERTRYQSMTDFLTGLEERAATVTV